MSDKQSIYRKRGEAEEADIFAAREVQDQVYRQVATAAVQAPWQPSHHPGDGTWAEA